LGTKVSELVPKPRKHLMTYHGVLAPASGLRSRVVPRGVEEAGEAGGCSHGAGVGGSEGENAAAAAVAAAVEQVDAAGLRRQQAEHRLRARLRVPHGGGGRRGGRRRYAWAELLQRAWGIEVLVCPNCSGVRRVLAASHDPASIARVLGAMGLSSAVPEQAGCRAPPAVEEFADVGEGTADRWWQRSRDPGLVVAGSGASVGSQSDGNGPETAWRDPVDGVVSLRQDRG
jgi:hypothetical protein